MARSAAEDVTIMKAASAQLAFWYPVSRNSIKTQVTVPLDLVLTKMICGGGLEEVLAYVVE